MGGGGIQSLRNAVGGGRVSDFPEKKALRRCRFNVISVNYEGVGGCRMSRKKALRNG